MWSNGPLASKAWGTNNLLIFGKWLVWGPHILHWLPVAHPSSMYMNTHVNVLYFVRSAASLQKIIYRLLSQACHRRRLDSPPVLPWTPWMGGTNLKLIAKVTYLSADQKVIAQDSRGECDFVLFWLGLESKDPGRSLSIYLFTPHLLNVYSSRKVLPCPHAGLIITLLLIQ